MNSKDGSSVQIDIRKGEILHINDCTVLVQYAEGKRGSYVVNVPRSMAPPEAKVGDIVRVTMRRRVTRIELCE